VWAVELDAEAEKRGKRGGGGVGCRLIECILGTKGKCKNYRFQTLAVLGLILACPKADC
jgi:hypothetical protein